MLSGRFSQIAYERLLQSVMSILERIEQVGLSHVLTFGESTEALFQPSDRCMAVRQMRRPCKRSSSIVTSRT